MFTDVEVLPFKNVSSSSLMMVKGKNVLGALMSQLAKAAMTDMDGESSG